ncbi:MAG: SURF1 family protein [Rhodospirillales bacterium]
MIKSRGFPVWLSLFTLVIVAGLFSLGAWQVQRLGWKQTLVAERDAARQGTALTASELTEVTEPARIEFRPVRLEGLLLHGKERPVYASSTDGKAGYHIFTPMLVPGGPTLFINRGWVDPEHLSQESRPQSLIAGPVTVTGNIRLPGQRGTFTPADNPEGNLWYTADPATLASGLGLPAVETGFYVVADRASTPDGGFPLGGQFRATLSNNHLIYAITWFSTGIAVLVAFVFFILSSRRRHGDAAS